MEATPSKTRTEGLRQALLRGRSITRQEAQLEFGITGSTFRWVIERMLAEGFALEYEIEIGHRQSQVRRWSMQKSKM